MTYVLMYALLWYVTGCASFVYWWTKDYDFTNLELATMLFVGILGPLSFIVGWSFHGKSKHTKTHILIKGRKNVNKN